MWSLAYRFRKIPPFHVYWFLRFFPPSTPRLLELCTSFFQKIPPSTFISTSTFSDLATFAPPPRLLKRWEYLQTNLSSHFRRTQAMETCTKSCNAFWRIFLDIAPDYLSSLQVQKIYWRKREDLLNISQGFTYLHTNSANHFWRTPEMEAGQRHIVQRRRLHLL